MSAVLRNGYVTMLEAANLLSRAMYAGVSDLPVVSRLREEGLSVDGQARDRAIAEIWRPSTKPGCEPWQSADDLVV
jgi:hypothetical protein